MMNKFDGVIEAVRYKGGKIDEVRAYERRGATFSDHVLLSRKMLLERVGKGRRFVVGQRKEFLASTFDIGKPVKLLGRENEQIITTRDQSERDELEGAPIF
jgi:hypothetical protein